MKRKNALFVQNSELLTIKIICKNWLCIKVTTAILMVDLINGSVDEQYNENPEARSQVLMSKQ